METTKVLNLQSKAYLWFLSDSQDTKAIKSYLGKKANPFNAFFVSENNGDYVEIWGIENTIPYLDVTAYRLK